MINEEIFNYYEKQIALPDMGKEGQDKLFESKIIVVGAGALGSTVLLHLVSAGIGTIGICDGDIVSISNLHRQLLYNLNDIGKIKAQVAAEKLRNKNPITTLIPYESMINTNNLDTIINGYDILIDCTDNYGTKFLLHDFCFMHHIKYIQGGVYQYDGEVYTLPYSTDNIDKLPCYRCLRKNIPSKLEKSVSKYGIISPVSGMIATIQAMETIRLILGNNLKESVGYIVSMHSGYNISKMKWEKDENCEFCKRKTFHR